jgi:hypothetical protein
MQGGGLENPNEHEDEATPRAEDLDAPSLPLRGKESIITARAISDVPKDVAAVEAVQ